MGRPISSESFLAALEAQTQRRLRPLKRGPNAHSIPGRRSRIVAIGRRLMAGLYAAAPHYIGELIRGGENYFVASDVTSHVKRIRIRPRE